MARGPSVMPVPVRIDILDPSSAFIQLALSPRPCQRQAIAAISASVAALNAGGIICKTCGVGWRCSTAPGVYGRASDRFGVGWDVLASRNSGDPRKPNGNEGRVRLNDRKERLAFELEAAGRRKAEG